MGGTTNNKATESVDADGLSPEVARFIGYLAALPTDQLRQDAIAAVGESFCSECGGTHPRLGRCQCWNDE